MRFVLSPDGIVAPDFSEKLPGRGAWVTARRDRVDAAVQRRLFARAFKAPAETPADLGAQVDAGLAKAALSALGLARRCGDALTGFEKVRAALKGAKAAVLIAASDGADDGCEKLAALAGRAERYALFSRLELSAALGQDAVHAAIAAGPSAVRFRKAADRLAAYRAGPEGPRVGSGHGPGGP